MVKNLPVNAGDAGLIPGSGRSRGEGNATHSSILDWEIPWTEGLGGLQSMRLQRVGHSFCFYGAKKSKCNGKYFVVIEFNNKRSLEVYRYIPFCLFT